MLTHLLFQLSVVSLGHRHEKRERERVEKRARYETSARRGFLEISRNIYFDHHLLRIRLGALETTRLLFNRRIRDNASAGCSIFVSSILYLLFFFSLLLALATP
jgi:hypothetical protein